MVAPSKRNCQIAQRITRTPRRTRGAHIRSSCSRNVTVWQVRSRHIQRRLNHRNLAGTPAQGASITSTTTRPWPCAIQPTTRAARQLVARLNIKHQSIWGANHAHQMEALQTDEQITPIKRHTAAAGRARHRPRPLKTARVEVRSSPGTSTSTRNPQPTPTHPHSTRKSQFDRGPGSARGRLRHVRARGAAPEDERIKRDGQGPARPGRSAPRTHAPRPRGGGGARRGACAPRSRHPCVT